MTVDDIHNRIFFYMENRQWSVYRLSEKSGVSISSLYNMIRRKTMPHLDTLERLCGGFDISLREFFDSDPFFENRKDLSEKDELLLEISHAVTDSSLEMILSYAEGVRDRELYGRVTETEG